MDHKLPIPSQCVRAALFSLALAGLAGCGANDAPATDSTDCSSGGTCLDDLSMLPAEGKADGYGSGSLSGYLACPSSVLGIQCPTAGAGVLYSVADSMYGGQTVDLSAYEILVGQCSEITDARDPNYSSMSHARSYYCSAELYPRRSTAVATAYYFLGEFGEGDALQQPFLKMDEGGASYVTRLNSEGQMAKVYAVDHNVTNPSTEGWVWGALKPGNHLSYDDSQTLKIIVHENEQSIPVVFYPIIPYVEP